MPKILLILLTTLIICSCSGKKEKQESETKSEPTIESKTEIKLESKLENDYSKSAELFAKDVLKENIRIHKFDLSNSKNPNHLGIFQSDGLQKIVAYSNKNYPKNSEPNYYEHFMLFVASYKDQSYSQNTYNRIRKESAYRFSDLQNSGDLADRVKALTIGAKPGGMIVKKGKWIFSLVETCRETPIGGNWVDYESKFLEYIIENGEGIQVLNANCGMDKYMIENRKASR